MHRDRKLIAIRATLEHEQLTKGTEVVFFCPRCEHRKPKLSVSLSTDKFHCWACDWSGKNLIPLMAKGSKERDEYIKEIEAIASSVPVVVDKKYDLPKLPNEFRSLTKEWHSPYYKVAMNYLRDRGLGREDILKWKLGYCEEGEYKYRIIVPSFDQRGDLNFSVGRTFYDNPQKYKHGFLCKDIIWNDYLVDWNKPITITEGPFDAFKVRDNVIALQGSILNEGSKLFSKIVFSGVDIYFAMDQDAFDKQLRILKNLVSYGVDCHYVALGGRKDVGEMSKEEFQDAKRRAKPVSTAADLLKLQVNV